MTVPPSVRPARPWRRRTLRVGVMAMAVSLASCGGGGASTSSTTQLSPTTGPSVRAALSTVTVPGAVLGPERVPMPNGPPLGLVNTANYGQPVDGIECQTTEQVVYHIHAHLSVFVDGQPRQVPLAIGIAPPVQLTTTPVGSFASGGSCFYWLHTHVADGVIHVESPSQKLYTLGQFFDVWGVPLSTGQVGPATGTVTTYVDGQPFTGNPRDIELKAHGQVQLDVGSVVPPQLIDWGPTGI